MFNKKYPDRKKNELEEVVDEAKRTARTVLAPDVVVDPVDPAGPPDRLGPPVAVSGNSSQPGSPVSGRRTRRSSENERSNSILERGTQFYQMDHGRRGDFIIFNFNVSGRNARAGALKDTENLRRCFKSLSFRVIDKYDQTKQEVFNTIDECSALDYSEADCFGMAILGHGKEGIISVADGEVKLDCIISRVKQCQNLHGKPKLFFVQSCRIIGDVETDAIVNDAVVTDFTPKVSIDADLLISYATTKGNVAFRIPESGSPYITKLTDVLEERGAHESILDLLTEVNAEVNDMIKEYGFSQITVLESTLNKKLVFDRVESEFRLCKLFANGRLEYIDA